MFDAFIEGFAGDGFAEHDGVALDDAVADGAVRRQLIDRELVEGPASAALDAAEKGAIPVDLGDVPTTRELVQVVDVLGDYVLQPAARFHVAEGEMAWIGDGAAQGFDELAELALALDAHLPPGFRIGGESLVVAEIRFTVLRPETVGAAEGGDAALRRKTGADERDGVPRGGDRVRCVRDGGSEALLGHEGNYRTRYDVVDMATISIALAIAGSDPSGGAGIQADLKTFGALGVYGMAAVTALTAQNTLKVTGVHEAPAEFVALQIDTIFADIRPDAVKTGMLANVEIIRVVAAKAWEHSFRNLVVDPVMVAKSGDRLLREDALQILREELIPHAFVLTPNLPEAGDILGSEVAGVGAMREAARELHTLGAANVVVKGGHLEGDEVVDVLFDGTEFHEFRGPRIETTSTHGTGCSFASAIAAYLARGETAENAVGKAKEYLTRALRHAYPVGHGHGPVHHYWSLWETQ